MSNSATSSSLTMRHLVVIGVALPVLVVAAVLAFAWPSARTAPRDLPVGIVGTSPAAQAVVAGLERAQPGGFDVHVYADQGAARDAIVHRDVYGAFVVAPSGLTVLEASAASPVVAQLLTTTVEHLAGAAHTSSTTVDVVPLASDDPRGAVLTSTLLPLTLGSVLAAVAIAMLTRVRPAWRQLAVLAGASALTGTGMYLIAQGFLGALPGDHLATWGTTMLTVLAISSTVAGLYAVLGTPGLAAGAGGIVFVGNAFSGISSAPDLLPDAVHQIGQWLPPGAAASLLRDTAYFHGHGAASHVAVLIAWVVFGTIAIVLGHHPSGHFTRRTEPVTTPVREPQPEPLPRHLITSPELVSANGHHAGAHEAG